MAVANRRSFTLALDAFVKTLTGIAVTTALLAAATIFDPRPLMGEVAGLVAGEIFLFGLGCSVVAMFTLLVSRSKFRPIAWALLLPSTVAIILGMKAFGDMMKSI